MKSQAQVKFESMSDIFRFVRKKLKLTQEELAVRLETCPQTVTRWETKRTKTPMFTAGQIKLLANLMSEAGIDLGDLPNT